MSKEISQVSACIKSNCSMTLGLCQSSSSHGRHACSSESEIRGTRSKRFEYKYSVSVSADGLAFWMDDAECDHNALTPSKIDHSGP